MQSTPRQLVFYALLALSALLTACGGGGGDAQPTPEVIGRVDSFPVKATQNTATYTIQAFVPASYATGTATLPAIYVTEGDAPFGANGVQSRFDSFKQVMQRRGTQAMLVGISGTQRRDTDFLLPGAAQYLHFITSDLAPAIEKQYRADPRRRVLSGLSHGGYFVVAALVLEGSAGGPSFSHYLSTESSAGATNTLAAYLAFEKQLDASGRALPTTLFLAGANAGNGPVVVTPLYQQMLAHNHAGLTLLKADYDTTHVGADVIAFEDALKRFFP